MINTLFEEFTKKRYKNKLIALFLVLILFGCILLSINLGRADITIIKTIKILLSKIDSNIASGIKESYISIVWDIRLPRIITAVVVGWGLAVSGAVFQSLLMNPLADSYTMGISSGAAFGASIAIFLNLFMQNIHLPVTLFAFVGAIVTLIIVFSIAKINGYINSSNMIIAGIIVSSIFSAGISFLKSLSGESVSAIIYWLMGNLSARSWFHVVLSFSVVAICTIICFIYSNDLNLMCLGDKEAKYLGVDTQKVRIILLICGSMITAVCVSVSGIIGFIGLIVPHMLRFLVGSDNRILLPLSALLGGTLLLLADTFTRTLMNIEIPVGVFTTLFGGPFFIYIFIKKNKSLY